MGATSREGVHVVSTALRDFVAVRHHLSLALAAFAEARSAPDEWHRCKAMRRVFEEIDGAEARLVAAIDGKPGPQMVMNCRREMVRIDAFASEVRLWAATIGTKTAEIVDFPRSKSRRGRRGRLAVVPSENLTKVNENLLTATDDAPAAC